MLAVFKIYSTFDDGPFLSGKGSSDSSGLWGYMSADDCKIFPVYPPVFCFSGKDISAYKMLGYNDNTGGVAVQTVAAAEDKGFPCSL